MHKLKSHKTVEQIAKKHRLDVSFIQKQLDMGEPIEHEHTKDHELAKDIALQHLDEIPDYYTRLKKMEASAKKEHKKVKNKQETVIIVEPLGPKCLPNNPAATDPKNGRIIINKYILILRYVLLNESSFIKLTFSINTMNFTNYRILVIIL